MECIRQRAGSSREGSPSKRSPRETFGAIVFVLMLSFCLLHRPSRHQKHSRSNRAQVFGMSPLVPLGGRNPRERLPVSKNWWERARDGRGTLEESYQCDPAARRGSASNLRSNLARVSLSNSSPQPPPSPDLRRPRAASYPRTASAHAPTARPRVPRRVGVNPRPAPTSLGRLPLPPLPSGPLIDACSLRNAAVVPDPARSVDRRGADAARRGPPFHHPARISALADGQGEHPSRGPSGQIRKIQVSPVRFVPLAGALRGVRALFRGPGGGRRARWTDDQGLPKRGGERPGCDRARLTVPGRRNTRPRTSSTLSRPVRRTAPPDRTFSRTPSISRPTRASPRTPPGPPRSCTVPRPRTRSETARGPRRRPSRPACENSVCRSCWRADARARCPSRLSVESRSRDSRRTSSSRRALRRARRPFPSCKARPTSTRSSPCPLSPRLTMRRRCTTPPSPPQGPRPRSPSRSST